MRCWTSLACGVWLFAAGCGDESDPIATDPVQTTSTSSTSSDGTTTTITTTVSGSASATTTSSSSTTTPPTTDDTSSSSGTPADSSSGDPTSTGPDTGSSGCTLGTAGCPCDEGGCDEGLECTIDDICQPPEVCMDDEYGDITTEDTAHFLGGINDNDDNGGTVMGVLTGPDDVDWFRYDGDDVAFQTVDPFRSVTAAAGLRFCKFANCGNGIDNTEFPCQDGAETVTSPDGRPGCCHPALIHVPDANCSGTIDDDMAIWIRLDQAEEACVPYAFNYHY